MSNRTGFEYRRDELIARPESVRHDPAADLEEQSQQPENRDMRDLE